MLRSIPHRLSQGCVAIAIAVALTVCAGSLQSSPDSASAADPASYRSEVFADGPVGYWRLAEPSGTTAADETGANPGTYFGGPVLGQPGALVDGNPAVRLDGVDDTTRVPTSSGLNPASALSVEAWVNATRLDPRKYAAVARKSGQYALSITAGAGVSFRLVQGGVTYEAKTANNTAPTGAWHHVVGTYDGTTMAVYVDGVARATRSLNGPIATSFNPLYLGSTQASSEWLTGGLDEVAVYPTALPAERVRAHYDKARTTPPPADTTPPAVTLTEPADGATTGAKPSFSGAAGNDTGDSSNVTVTVYSGTSPAGTPVQTLTTTRAGSAWSATASAALDPGTYTAQAEQSDAAGNTGRSAARTFTVEALPGPSYAGELMTDGPRGYWRLGESSGTAATDETGAFPGTYSGGVALGAVGAIAGDSNTAARLDGIDDTVKVLSSPGLNTANALTLEAWMKPAQLPATSASIIRKEGQYLLRLTSTGQLVFRLWKAGTAYELRTANGVVTTGSWQHVAVTYDGATMRLYVNGAPSGSLALAGPVDVSTASLYFGSSSQSYDWLSGPLDEVAVYDKALSATRVQARYQAATTTSDTVAPTVTLTQPAAGATVSDGRPTFAGEAGDAAGDSDAVTVKVYAGASVSGTPAQTLTATRSGSSWSVRSPSQLAGGTYTAQAEQSDAAGNLGRSATTTFTVQAPAPTTYAEEVLLDGARGYWRLGELIGTTAADETGVHAGTYGGGVTLGRAGALSTDANTAALFDGVNGNVRIADGQALNFTNALTLEAWLNPTKLPTSSATVMRKDLQYMLRLNSNGSVTFRLWKGGVAVEAKTGANVVTPGSWHQLVATFDGSAMRVYVNTREVVSLAAAGTVDVATTPLQFATSGGYDLLAGTLDEIAVYDKALSATRINEHYQRAAPPDTSAPAVALKTPLAGTTMDATPNFGGLAGTASGDSADVTVKLYSGTSASGTPVARETATKRSTGVYSVKVSTPLPSGTYTAQAEQSDAAGNVGKSSATTFTVDASGDPKIAAAGDIAGCSTVGDEATADVLDGLPGTVTSLGDHAYEHGTAAQFECYDQSWGRHKARTRPILGDHEFGSPGAAPYFDYFGAAAGEPSKAYYSYNLGSWHVVALDSYCWQTGGCPGQLEWLRQDLFASTASCTVALIHEPRFSSGSIHGNTGSMQAFWEALYDANAEVVLSASEHVYERFAPQTPTGGADAARGLRQFTVGTGGRSLYSFGTVKPNSEVRNNDAFGVLSMTLRSGGYDWKFVPEAGKTFVDSGSGVCH